MLRVEHYLYLPGCCWICRGVALPTIDTGIDLDGHNSPDDPNPSAVTRFYVCADCALELARMVMDSRNMEFVKLGTIDSLNEMNQVLSESNLALSTRVEELENAMRVLKSVPDSVTKPQPSAAKKNFKVAQPSDVDV